MTPRRARETMAVAAARMVNGATAPHLGMRTIWSTALALIAFAANSVLCRIALRQGVVDPATFSTVRVIAGAVTLLLVARWMGGGRAPAARSWLASGLLALYAVPFAFAYTRLGVATGALILFGAVQATMLAAAVRSGETPHIAQWIGLTLALAGLVYLLLPGLSAPPPMAAMLMGLAGVAWGLYSVHGRHSVSPLAQTTSNFVYAVPLVLIVSAAGWSSFHLEARGLWLAIASGAVASGLGYVVWYAALGSGLTATSAAVVQLSVPVLAGAGGVMVLGESVSTRLAVSAAVILGGIAFAIVGPERARRARVSAG